MVSPLPLRKRGRLEDAALPPSTPITTPRTPKPLPNDFEERDVILCDACAKYPSKHEYNMDSHFFTGINDIRRYYLGAPVLTSKSVHVCDAREKDLTTLRRTIDKVCVCCMSWHKFGTSESVLIARTLCVSSIISGGASNVKEKEGVDCRCLEGCH